MGCITAVPVHVRVYERVEKMAEINFLCVHKKLRFETVYLVRMYIFMYCMYVCMYVFTVRMLVNQLSFVSMYEYECMYSLFLLKYEPFFIC